MNDTRLTRTEVLRILGTVGFNEIQACDMLRIAERESGLDPRVANTTTAGIGLYSIHTSWVPQLEDAGIIESVWDLFDPVKATEAAKWLYDQGIRWPL